MDALDAELVLDAEAPVLDAEVVDLNAAPQQIGGKGPGGKKPRGKKADASLSPKDSKKARRGYGLPHPSKRTPEQKAISARFARDGKRNKTHTEDKAELQAFATAFASKTMKGKSKQRRRDLRKAILSIGKQKKTKKADALDERITRDLEVAFDHTLLRAGDLQKTHEMHNETLRTSQIVVAASCYNKQLDLLEEWTAYCRDQPPLAAHELLAFDSATSRVRLDLRLALDHADPDLELNEISYGKGWHCLVSEREVILTFPRQDVSLALAVPIIPCDDTSANSMYRALFELEASAELQRRIRALTSTAPVSTITWGVDGAFGNEKLFEHTEQTAEADPMTKLLCKNHRVYLIETAAQQIAGEPATNGVWQLASWMRGGSNHLRCVASVLPTLRHFVDIEIGEPPAGSNLLAQELMDYVLTHHQAFRRAIAIDGENASQRVREKIQQRWRKHLSIWNGPMEDRQRIRVFVPHEVNRESHLKKMATSFCDTVLAHVLPQPEMGKWTKFSPAVEWIATLDLHNGMLSKLVEQACATTDLEVVSCPDPGDAAPRTETLRFHKMDKGPKVTKVKEIAADITFMALYSMFLLILEPVRFLTCFFLKASRDIANTCRSPVLDWLNSECSPSIAALQYLRSVGRGTAARCRIVFGCLGCASMQELMRHPVHRLKGVCFVIWARAISAAVYRRVDLPRRALPVAGAQLADGRVGVRTRVELARRIVEKPGCCVGRFWERLLRALPLRPSAEDLLEENCQRLLHGWVRILDRGLTIARLERRNKRTRTIITQPSMRWADFVSVSLLREISAIRDGARRHAVQRSQQFRPPRQDDKLPPPPKKPKRGLSAFEVWLTEYHSDQKVAGENMKYLGWARGFRRQKVIEYRHLAPHRRAYYQGQSNASKAAAAHARRQYEMDLRAWAQANASRSSRSSRQLASGAVPTAGVEGMPHGPFPVAGCRLCAVAGRVGDWHLPPTPLDGMVGLEEECVPCASLAFDGEREDVDPSKAAVGLSASAHREVLGRSNSREHAQNKFQATCSRVACDRQSIPERALQYALPCPEICKHSPLAVRKLQAELLFWYSRLVDQAQCKSEDISTKMIFIEHHVICDEEEETCVVALDHALKRSGPHLPQQVFTQFSERKVRDGRRLLFPDTQAYVENTSDLGRRRIHKPVRDLDIGNDDMGPYKHYAELELTGFLLKRLVGVTQDEVMAVDMSVHVHLVSVCHALWDPGWGVPEMHDVFEAELRQHAASFHLHPDRDVGDRLGQAVCNLGKDFLDAAHPDADLFRAFMELSFATGEEEAEEEEEEGAEEEEEEEAEEEEEEDQDSGDEKDEFLCVDYAPDPIGDLLRELRLLKDPDGTTMRDEVTGRKVGEYSVLTLSQPVIRCKCGWHDGCMLMLPAGRDYYAKTMAALRWLGAGRHLGDSRPHQEALRDLKIRFGIKPRTLR